jgi:hypothetical protein
MLDRAFSGLQDNQGGGGGGGGGGGDAVAEGSTRTLFVAFSGKAADRFSHQEVVAEISATCEKLVAGAGAGPTSSAAVPIDTKLHVHRETGLFKGSAHVKFKTPAIAEAVLNAGLKKAKLFGHAVRAVYRAPEMQSGGGGGGKGKGGNGGGKGGRVGGKGGGDVQDQQQQQQQRQQRGFETRLAMAKLALSQYAYISVARDLPHACGVLLVGSDVQEACQLTPSLTYFEEQTAGAVAAAGGEGGGGGGKGYGGKGGRGGGQTALYAALSEAAEQLRSFGDAHQNSALRVIAITDGEDTSGDPPWRCLSALHEARVTVVSYKKKSP